MCTRSEKFRTALKAIPTKLVLRIKLNQELDFIKLKSDGTVEKYKVRCVALGFLQHAGLYTTPTNVTLP